MMTFPLLISLLAKFFSGLAQGCARLCNSVATTIADIFQNNGISVGRNLAKVLKIFEKIDEAKS